MNERNLARDYFSRAKRRLRILDAMIGEELYPDTVRESQEVVELVLKGLLRKYSIDPPKVHDVGPFLGQYRDSFLPTTRSALVRLIEISLELRRSREASFYGDADEIPSDTFGKEDALRAKAAAAEVVSSIEPEFKEEKDE